MLAFKYKHEIVAEYGFDRKTLYNKLKRFDIVIGRGLISPAQQKVIYECLGYPTGVDEKDFEEVTAADERENK